jgi:hypothetical protein
VSTPPQADTNQPTNQPTSTEEHVMVSKFTGKGDRERLAALGDVEAREQQAVAEAQERRAAADADEFDGSLVTITEDDLEAVSDQGTIVVFTGTDDEERIVTFGVDHRVAQDIVNLVREQGELVCGVEDWQVLRRTSPVVV